MTVTVPITDLTVVEIAFGSKNLKATIVTKRRESVQRAFVGILWEAMGTVPVAVGEMYASLLTTASARAAELILDLRAEGYEIIDCECNL